VRRLALVLAVPACAALALLACGPDKPPVAAPPAPLYDDLRVLSHDDCVALRDHQIQIAVEEALRADGGPLDAGAGVRESIEAELRSKSKDETAAWIKRCSAKVVRARDLRCMRDARSLEAFVACGKDEDLAVDGGSGADGDAASGAALDARPDGG
jgi:hypothetical protein